MLQKNNPADLQQGSDPADLFGFKINYNTIDGNVNAANKLYNGNIAETFWSTATDGGFVRNYGYKYDKLNRLKDATYQKTGGILNNYDENLTYDKNGNILSLMRMGNSDTQSIKFLIDELKYEYTSPTSNQLAKVTEGVNGNSSQGFIDDNTTGNDYEYDANGNMTVDKNKNITTITYNHLNLPTKIIFPTGNIVYFYNASGQKVQKVVTENTTVTTTDYLGGYQYKNAVLQYFPTAEGYVEPNGSSFKYVYQYKDHLGNVRLSYTKNTTTNALDIIEENNYYPFGLKHNGYNPIAPAPEYKYKFNGKELQDENIGGNQLNLYDFGARNYDPALGRWMNIDPLAEVSRRWNPYTYCYSNPLRFTDPDGMLSFDNMNPNQNETEMRPDDWVKNGKDIFYDKDVTSQAQATAKYGEKARHLDEGSTLTGTSGGKTDYQYTFHDNGTITDMDGGNVSAKETFKTKGGTTIVGTESKGVAFQFSFNGALGGGFGLDIGLVRDSAKNWGLYFNRNINVGLGADTGFSINPISPTHNGPFLLDHFAGQSYSINGGIEAAVGVSGVSGGTLSSNTSALGKFNPLNYGSSDNNTGYTSFSRSLFYGEVTGGAMYRKSSTSVIKL